MSGPLQSNSASSTASQSSLTCNFNSALTPGSTIVIGAAGSFTSSANFSDPTNGTYSKVVALNGNAGLFVAWVHNTSSAALTVTFNYGGTSSIGVLAIAEWPGLATVAFDQQSSNSSGSSTTSATSNSTPTTTQANELLLSWIYTSFGYGTLSAGSGYTLDPNQAQLGKFGAEYQTVSAAGAYAGTFTYTTSENYVCAIATFKIATLSPAFGRCIYILP